MHRWVGNTLVKSTAMVGLSIFEGVKGCGDFTEIF